MAISSNYPQPVQVNGFTCKNCTDVDYAKKHIDPAHPKSGPYGVNAASDPTQKAKGELEASQTSTASKSVNAPKPTTTAALTAPGATFSVYA